MMLATFVATVHGYATPLSEGLIADGFVKYYNYAGSLAVSGVVSNIKTSVEGGLLNTYYDYSLTGVDTACNTGAGVAANSCGIHIHAGVSCTEDAGAHFYVNAVTTDPWTIDYSYTSTVGGATSGHFKLATGATTYQTHARTFIVHAYDGSRIACATIGDPIHLEKLSAIPRVTKDNCHNIHAIMKGERKAVYPIDVTKPGESNHQVADTLKKFPILNDHNCALLFPKLFG